MNDTIRTTDLPTGLRVVTESMSAVRSVAVGCYVAVGGRDEAEALSGASHFLEHLLFKGTQGRPARQIADAVDVRGGEMNAYTSREHTAFYLRLPAEELSFATDLLADVVTAPALRDDEVDTERQVILEELLMSEDDSEDRAHNLCMEALFPDHPIGREVLGSEETIRAMSRDQIADFHRSHYGPANLVLVAAGQLDHDQFVDQVSRGFAEAPTRSIAPERVAPHLPPESSKVLKQETEQVHITVGWRAFGLHDPDRYPLAVLNHVMGSGMSSRLFREIRELRGLAYSVYSYSALYSDAGTLMVYAGTAPENVAEVLNLVDTEVASLLASGITDHELEVAKGYLTGSMVLGLEDSASRMSRLGGSVITRGEVIDIDTHLSRLRAVEAADVRRVIERLLGVPASTAAVGPLVGHLASGR